MTRNNYFSVSRELLNSSRWIGESFTRGQAWVDLFGLANHKKGSVHIRGIFVEIERGQLAYSQLTLSKRWKWGRGKVRRFLNELEKRGDLIQQNNQVTTLVTIVNYDLWQGDSDTTSGTTDGQQTDNRRYTNNKNKEEYKNKELDTNISSRVSNETSTTVDRLYQLFLTEFDKTESRVKLTPERRAKIRLRVKDAGEDMVAKAIRNTAASPWHRGENDRGWKATLDFIVQSYEKVERLSEMEVKSSIDPNGEELRKKWMTNNG